MMRDLLVTVSIPQIYLTASALQQVTWTSKSIKFPCVCLELHQPKFTNEAGGKKPLQCRHLDGAKEASVD